MIYPKIVRGGNAIPIGDNFFLMKGRKHKNGGIDIGKDLEVEGGEVMQTSPNEIKVFSAQKFLGGESPAELILSGANPDKVFAAQEQYKKIHGINDDGTKKKAKDGGLFQRFINFISGNENDSTKTPVNGNNNENIKNNVIDLKDKEFRKLTGEFIRQAENPTKEGFDEKTKRWYAPNKKGYDKNNFGYGIDRNTAKNEGILKIDSTGKEYITDEDMWRVHNNAIEKIFDDNIPARLSYAESIGKPINLDKANMMRLASIIYRAGSSWVSRKLFDEKTNNDTTSVFYNFMNNASKNDSLAVDNAFSRYHNLQDGNNSRNEREINFINTHLRGNTTKKQYGGMTNKENNANILGYVPSTGKRKKALEGTILGSDGKEYTSISEMPSGVTSKLHNLAWNDPNGYKAPTYVVTPGLNPTNSNGNPTNSNGESNQDEEDILAGQKKLKTDYWLTTGLGALSKTAAGITGAIINNSANRKYLGQMEGLVNKMKAYQIPLTKLKTRYNINPQLAEIENALRIGKNDIDANTASSQAALARKRTATLNATLEKNKLYGQKENIETKLTNDDRLQQAQTIAENIRNTQNIENQKLQMLADIVDKRSENASATTQNIVGSVVGGIDTILNGANTYGQMLAGMAKSPDGANAILGRYGRQQRERKIKKKNNDTNLG